MLSAWPAVFAVVVVMGGYFCFFQDLREQENRLAPVPTCWWRMMGSSELPRAPQVFHERLPSEKHAFAGFSGPVLSLIPLCVGEI